MPGGRPPKPTNLKVLHGTARADRVNAHEPKPQPLGPDAQPPRWLDAKGRREWRRLREQLERMGVVTEADADALALLADAYVELHECRAVVRRLGRSVEITDSDGNILAVKKRPEVEQASDAWRRVNQMMQQFGLTPSSRAKVSATPVEELDPLEELLRGRSG